LQSVVSIQSVKFSFIRVFRELRLHFQILKFSNQFMDISVGATLKRTMTVGNEHLASRVGSGGLDVFATPSMIAFMEGTALQVAQEFLPETSSTVGTLVNVKHVKASPLGTTITCEATITEVDGRRLVYEVKAFDNNGLIGEGIHERFVVDCAKFMAKVSL
jgi:predicted thioesterase